MQSTLSFEESLLELELLAKKGAKPGLERMQKALKLLENPQDKFKSILVGGTNGKGSTTLFLSNILKCSGYNVGTFISPPIFSYRERIQLGLEWISKEDFVNIYQIVKNSTDTLEDKPSFFEYLTLMAIIFFSKKDVDYAIFEVGMGGRLDSTNSLEPIISILTSIGLEHISHLGDTVQKIAYEKVYIARAGKPLISTVKNNKARQVIGKYCDYHGIDFLDVSSEIIDLDIANYQLANATAAFYAAKLLGIDDNKIFFAIMHTNLVGRMQKISTNPDIYIDSAHNCHAAKHMLSTLKKEFREVKSLLIYASMSDKDYIKTLRLICDIFDSILLVNLDMERAESPQKLQNALKKMGYNGKIEISDSAYAIERAKEFGADKILVFGSIYLLQSLFGDESINQPN
jgi:dihydrofolate synthase / folylpolyglutamate synthase